MAGRVRSAGASLLALGGSVLLRASRRVALPRESAGRTLLGDRDVEWAWIVSHLRRESGRLLDLGAAQGNLSLAAAFAGHAVVGVDLEPQAFLFEDARVEFRQGDFNAMEFEARSFDQVLCCSTIEHFGLGGRYLGAADEGDADLVAMGRVAELLRPDGTLVLTVPVGRDDVFRPYHRVYGSVRLPRLLERFEVVEESYRAKPTSQRWVEVGRDEALAEPGSASYYALGLFVLSPR